MLGRLFPNYIRKRFFHKLMLSYSAIIVLSIGLLIYLIVYNVSSILRQQAVNYNQQVLQSVGSYFHDQHQNFKKMMQYLYAHSSLSVDLSGDARLYDIVVSLLGEEEPVSPEDSSRKREMTLIFNRFLNDVAMPSDPDIFDIMVTNRQMDRDLGATRNTTNLRKADYYGTIKQVIAGQRISNINSRKVYAIPAFTAVGNGSSIALYGLYDYLRDADDASRFSGYVALTFTADSVKMAYERLSGDLIGTIMIFTDDGNLLFDSSDAYSNEPFPYLDEIRHSRGHSISDRDNVVNFVKDEAYGFITVGVIPKSELFRKVNDLNRLILSISGIVLLVLLGLTFLNTSMFSNRVKGLIKTMKDIQKGHLAAKSTVTGSQDEIDQIARNLNVMGRKLEEYIHREYVSELRRTEAELRRKTSELYALQSQINPHFLFNTLESIRMRALSTGENEVSEMIKILARLFRSNVQEEMIVSVQDELGYCRSLLDLYGIRFQDRLEVTYDVDEDVLPFGILKHLLQPIIENAVAHGIDPSRYGNHIIVAGRLEAGHVRISVTDNGQGIDERTAESLLHREASPAFGLKSIGIANVLSRIQLTYGERCGLQIDSTRGVGTTVTMTINAWTKEELRKHVQSADR